VHQCSHDLGLGVADLEAGAPVRTQLSGGVAHRGESAQDQEFALRQSQPVARVEVTEAELGEEPGQGLVERLGQVGQIILDLVAVEGRLLGEALGVPLRVRDCALRWQRQRDVVVPEDFVDGGDRVEGTREAEERGQLVYRFTDLDGRDADVEGGSRV